MRNKIGLLAVVLWGVTVAAGITLFVRGYTTTSPDCRIAVIVTEAEKDLVLGEMRGMLLAVADITQALSHEDRAAIAAAARKVGTAAEQGAPPALKDKLPLEFKTSAVAMHASFDRIEMAATAGKPMREITALLADHLKLCVGCHAGYRFAQR